METAAATPTLSPMTQLEACLRPLQGLFAATTKILGSYCNLLYLAHRAVDSERLRLLIRLEASEEWSELQSTLPQVPTGIAQMILPAFEEVWAEVTTTIDALLLRNPARRNSNFWEQRINYHGLMLRPVTILVFDTLLDLSPSLEDWLRHIIQSQPRYNDVQGDLQGQFNARQLLGTDTIPDLARSISAVRHEYTEIETTIGIFAKLVQNAINHYQDMASASSNHSTLNQYLDELVDQHRFLISNPFSELPLAIRQLLASCDIRGTMRLLVRDAASLLDRPFSTGLSWDMFKNFVNGLMQVVNEREPEFIDSVRRALFELRLGCFLDPNAPKDDTWRWIPEEEEYEYESDSEVDSEVDLDDLSDVCFEPVGPSLKVENHAFAVTKVSDLPGEDCSICCDELNVHQTVRDEVPVKAHCGHTFHYGCLNTLINGISKFSNLCPNCREEVCHRRPKRQKDSKDFESAQSSGTRDEAEPGRSLQDRYGDVVMTDE